MEYFQLPPLPFGLEALSPYCSEETLLYHYDRHHKGYCTQLNRLLSEPDNQRFQGQSLETIIQNAPQGPLFNNAAQLWNHSFFWSCLGLAQQNRAEEVGLGQALCQQFGSLESFKQQLLAKALSNFGSGWTWLVKGSTEFEIVNTSNAHSPIQQGLDPILVIDGWEHAYYIDYRNNRSAYLEAIWLLLNWKALDRYASGSAPFRFPPPLSAAEMP